MSIKFTNNASGILASSITNTATSLTLATGQGSFFPALSAGEFFYATLVDSANNLEIIKVTARTGDGLTIVRGQDSTLARAYSAGDKLELRAVAAVFSEFVQLLAAQTISGAKTFAAPITLASPAILNNEVNLQAKDSGGTTRSLLRLNNGNNVLFLNAGNGLILFRNQADSATLVSIDGSGNVVATGDVTSSSDERLKQNIETLTNALATVKALRGVSFVKGGKPSLGLIAQEVQRIVPCLVHEDSDGYLSVAYANMVGLLIEAVKQLSDRVETLEKE